MPVATSSIGPTEAELTERHKKIELNDGISFNQEAWSSRSIKSSIWCPKDIACA